MDKIIQKDVLNLILIGKYNALVISNVTNMDRVATDSSTIMEGGVQISILNPRHSSS